MFAASNVQIIGENLSLGLPVSFISGGFYGPRGVLSDFEEEGGRVPKEYSRTDLGSCVHGHFDPHFASTCSNTCASTCSNTRASAVLWCKPFLPTFCKHV